jgi:hypothetical protein
MSDPTPQQTTEDDRPDTEAQIAYRRGKSAGYSVGLVDGWDACMLHFQNAFDKAIAVAVSEPKAVTRHRDAVAKAKQGQEAESHE